MSQKKKIKCKTSRNQMRNTRPCSAIIMSDRINGETTLSCAIFIYVPNKEKEREITESFTVEHPHKLIFFILSHYLPLLPRWLVLNCVIYFKYM